MPSLSIPHVLVSAAQDEDRTPSIQDVPHCAAYMRLLQGTETQRKVPARNVFIFRPCNCSSCGLLSDGLTSNDMRPELLVGSLISSLPCSCPSRPMDHIPKPNLLGICTRTSYALFVTAESILVTSVSIRPVVRCRLLHTRTL